MSETRGNLISPAEAAKWLTISVKTLREHVRIGSLASVNVGAGLKRRHYAFDPTDIEDFIRKRSEFGRKQTLPAPSPSRGRRRRAEVSDYPILDLSALIEERKAARKAQQKRP